MTKDVSRFTAHLVQALNDIAGGPKGEGDYVHSTRFAAMPGKARDRVTMQQATHHKDAEPNFDGAQTFVRCFVDNSTGAILYSGSWTTPAKWKDGPAIEFGGSVEEHEAYAEFIRDGGWGYKGDRKRWEEAKEAKANA